MPYFTVDSQLVSQILSDYPVTRDELHSIRDPRSPARFQGVYGHRHGGVNRGDSRYVIKAYRARVFKFWELGSNFETTEAAARAVVGFYKAYFGAPWARAFRYRKVIPWRTRHVDRPSPGFAVDIYVRGRPVGITRADTGEGRSCEWVWGTLGEAKLAAREAMRRRFERERPSLPIPAPGLVFWRG